MIYLILFWGIIGFLAFVVLSFIIAAYVYFDSFDDNYWICLLWSAIGILIGTIIVLILIFGGSGLVVFLKWLWSMYETSKL